MGKDKKASTAMLSIYSNSFLVALKLIAGILMGSISVISEGIHSMIDLIAAIIANYSVRKSAIPADKDHPYGHGKYENYAGVIEAVLIFFAALVIIYESMNRLINNAPVELLLAGILIMGISMVVNFFVSRRLYRVGLETDSMALQADGLHLRTDVYTSLGVFLGLILIQLTGYTWLDPIVAILVALLIVKAAWDLTREASKGLVDEQLPMSDEAEIKGVLARHSKDYVAYHSLRTRKSGAERFVDLVLVVPADMGVAPAHALCDRIEEEIRDRLPHTNVLIHLEPCKSSGPCVQSPDHIVTVEGEKEEDKLQGQG